MKWLYRILRLIKCPHKYSKTLQSGSIIAYRGAIPSGTYYEKECRYCGAVKSFQV